MWHSGNIRSRIARNKFTSACPNLLPRGVSCCSLLLEGFRTRPKQYRPNDFGMPGPQGALHFVIGGCFVAFLRAVVCRAPRRSATELRVKDAVALRTALCNLQKYMSLSLRALGSLHTRVTFFSTRGWSRVMVRRCDVHDTLYFIFFFNLVENKLTIKVMVSWW